MYASMWNLPGPYRFAADIAGDLREGRNVLAVYPTLLPSGLYRAVSRELADADLGPLERISAEAISQGSPAYGLHQFYNMKKRPQNGLDIASLCRCDGFQSRIIWLEGIETLGKKAALWLDFLKHYACTCGSRDLIDRTVFAVPIRGGLALDNLPVENLLTQHWFWGRVSSLDLQLLAAQITAERRVDSLEKRLLVNVAASLCGFDVESAQAFCREAAEVNAGPYGLFESLAISRGWENHKVSTILKEVETTGAGAVLQNVHRPGPEFVGAWAEGLLDLADGRIVTSPAVEAARGNKEEIRLRIWRGHVQTLLPVIDEYRIQVIRHLTTNYPFLFKSGENSFESSEIGTLKYRIEADPRLRRRVDKDMRSLVRLLANIRNDLAHLKPVSRVRRARMAQAMRNLL